MPLTALAKQALLGKACRSSAAAGQTLKEYLEAAIDKSPALTGKPLIQSTSAGGLSSSFFAPGEGGAMTGTDEVDFAQSIINCIPWIEEWLEAQLGRPPTHTEICAALNEAIPPGVTSVASDFTGMRWGCGCGGAY